MARKDSWWRRSLRLAAVLLGCLLVGCLCLALGLVACLPWLLEQAVARELSRRGLGGITVGVQAVSWNQATLGPVAVCGEDGIVRAEAIVLRYEPSRLRHYQVDAVEVVGLRLRMLRRGPAWVPCPEATLRRALAEALRLLPAGAAPSAYPTLELRSSQLELEADGEVLTLPLEGTAHLLGTGPSRVQAVVGVGGAPVTIRAVLDLASGAGTATVVCPRFDVGAWLQAASRVGLPVPDALAAASGTGSLDLQAELSGYACSGYRVEALLSGLQVPAEPVPLRLRDGTLTVHSGPDLRRPLVTFTAAAESIAYGVRLIEPFRCSGTWQDDALELTATDVRFHLGRLVQGTAQVRLSAQGLSDVDTARLELGLDLTSAEVASLGPFAGHLRAVGTARELWLNGALDAGSASAALGLAALTLDGRLQRGEGTEADLTATLTLLPDAVAAKLGAGVRLSGASMPLELTVALALPRSGPWHCRGRVELSAQRLGAMGVAGLEASGTLSGQGQVDADAAGLTCAGRLHAEALTVTTSDAALAAEALTVSLDALRLPWSGAGMRVGTVAAPGLEFEAQVALRNGTVHLPNGLQCNAINLSLPVAWSRAYGWRERPEEVPGDDRLHTGPIRFGRFAATALRGRCRQSGPTLRFEGELECTAPAVTIGLTQTIDWSKGLALALHYAVPPLRVQGDEEWYPKLPGLTGLRLAGTLALEGDLILDRQGARTPCRLRLTEGEFTWPQQKLTVSGLDADLRLEDMLQARTAPFQTIRFSTAKIQDIPIDGGQIVFAAAGPESLSLLRCELNWCGGQVHTEAVQLNPRNLDLDLVLFAENVDFIRALSLVKGFKAKGSGVLNGKLPISYHQGRLTYASGYLYSVPGQPGSLQLQSTGWLTSAVPPDNPAYGELQQAEKALEDFRLDIFRLEFTGKQAGTPGAKIQLAGEGVNGKVPVTLNLNVNGPIEEALNVGLRLGGM